ncbi:hypothetical protein AJ80_00894 [Polytolypa hystricis UAMH7299]|uniref:Alpha/beta hydrolase fold-3 domain-containing protein n=1 Tax=Polytolypa hystricis (strain UAMH7299) TaxID=1447883 RepID=A0A2B7Z0G5_POLH7|nr:hypothetical protein AJ80_00894 [Polytolypa hystricis UAMH7299]
MSMNVEPSVAALTAFLRRVPMLLKTIVLNVLSISPASRKQNLRMEVVVALIRSYLDYSSPPGKAQRGSMKDPGIKGRMWVSKITMPKPPENDALDSLRRAIDSLKEGDESYDVPEIGDVEAEWTGYRAGVRSDASQPDVDEAVKYERLMEEVTEDLTILYFHGGAYHLMDPCTHRSVTSKLAKLTRGRCLSVRYRLAPQNPFPAALLDALVSYLYLLSPPEGSLHAPVPAGKIVFAGDSAGAGLSLALLQTLLALRRMSPDGTIRFHGKDIPIQLPAGVTTSSPWCDQTRSLPSTFANAKFDYLRPPHQDTNSVFTPIPFPEDAIWPLSPPRVDFYAYASAAIHPLVSPLAGPSDIWKDAPPIFITIGEESLQDEGFYLARKIHRVGGTVTLEHFEGMPHCFALIFLNNPAAKRCFRTWAAFCVDAVHGRVERTGKAVFLDRNGKNEEMKDLEGLGELSDEEVQKRLKAGRDWRVEGEKDLISKWMAKAERARL